MTHTVSRYLLRHPGATPAQVLAAVAPGDRPAQLRAAATIRELVEAGDVAATSETLAGVTVPRLRLVRA